MRVIIVSGYAGAGKSSAIKTLEDVGFYCIDNLPVLLVSQSLSIISKFEKKVSRLALVVDARDRLHLNELPLIVEKLKNKKMSVEVLFFEAQDTILARRFSETRRRHPLSPKGSALEGIHKEKKFLEPIRQIADFIIDTTEMRASDLNKYLINHFAGPKGKKQLAVTMTSFGFKYGIPMNADLLFDVRFIKNPFFEKKLKNKTGLRASVKKFVMDQPEAAIFVDHVVALLNFLLPKFADESKSYLNICIGCTGGKHRSVVLVNQLAKRLKKICPGIMVDHRDIEVE